MADESDQEKELPASERKIQKAREEGDIPRSKDFGGGATLFASIAALYVMGGSISKDLQSIVHGAFEFNRREAFDPSRMGVHLVSVLLDALWALAPFLILVLVVALAASHAVGGLNWTTKSIGFKISNLSPAKGIKNIVSMNALVELAKAVLKCGVIAGVGFYLVIQDISVYSTLAAVSLKAGIVKASQMIAVNMMVLCGLYLAITAFDVPYQIWKYRKKLRMSFEEIKKEHKESDGDPYIKSRIRQIQREMAKRRMMAAIPGADVIVTNPTHYSVAIKYDRDALTAPRVVAKGTDDVAFKIREIAREAGVPVVEAPSLARALHKNVEVERIIPDSLFRAVAKVLAYVYSLNNPVPTIVDLPTEEDIPEGMDPGVEAA